VAKGGKQGGKSLFPDEIFIHGGKKERGSDYENQQNLGNRLFLSSSSVQPIET
jgi:hypothetical protein